MIEFFTWTLLLYCVHRLAHKSKWMMQFHGDHHRYANTNVIKWHWSNFFFFTDTKKSTIDLWLTEVIPTILFCVIIKSWWILIFYWFWAAFVQEVIEHNYKINIQFWSSGQWHLAHHKDPTTNFGLFFTIWDVIFKTNMKANT